MRLPLSAFFLICVAGLACAEPIGESKLNELRSRPLPKQQADLDTAQLASAHRERAASVQEKTEGLWQSWLVSICDGCNPRQRRPAEIEVAANAYKPTNKPVFPISQSSASTYRKEHSLGEVASKTPRTLLSDLSSKNVSQIRLMPTR